MTQANGQWYILRYPGSKWAPIRLPSSQFITCYEDKFEWRGPFEDIHRALTWCANMNAINKAKATK
jgi:hypothetical protein